MVPRWSDFGYEPFTSIVLPFYFVVFHDFSTLVVICGGLCYLFYYFPRVSTLVGTCGRLVVHLWDHFEKFSVFLDENIQDL